MSVQRPDPEHDAAELRQATERLIDAVSVLAPTSVAEPSRLAGWTRGHVLTHLSRNADSLVNLLIWARTGEEVPQYASGESRDRDIEAYPAARSPNNWTTCAGPPPGWRPRSRRPRRGAGPPRWSCAPAT